MNTSNMTASNHPRVLHVLLVEDNPGDARLVQKRLDASYYPLLEAEVELHWADRLSKAITMLGEDSFDAMLLDLGLPESQGLETLERFSEHLDDLPVIVLTGFEEPQAAVQAVRAGAQDYLHKNSLGGDQIARTLRYALERKYAEREMRTRITKMDRIITMGTLAAGAAHEINNPLAFVTSNIQYAINLLEKPSIEQLPETMTSNLDQVLDGLKDALEGSQRVCNVVRDLRRLAGGGPDFKGASMEQVSVEDVLESSLNIARNHIIERAKLTCEIESVPQVMASESKLGQVFLNLMINAAQAIPPGNVAGNTVRIDVSSDNDDVIVTISDTGCGIPERDLPKVFEPFFTTKRSDEGIGLGLAISKQIISGLGGNIEVDSTIDKGTTFRVLLPSSESFFAQMTEAEDA